MKKRFLTLGIESSCDETAVSVVADGRDILSNVISSQIDIHTLYGGVVPEIASRHHLENINGVVSRALRDAGVALSDVDLIGVTNGPGLIGAVVIGVATAKALSLAGGIPLVGVNHMHGHVSANYIAHKDLKPPFISLVVSGGHTEIIRVTDYNECEVLGETRDDAAGEAFDKVARVIGLGYPGGPKIMKAAESGDPEAFRFKRVMMDSGDYDFSFSGIKTQVLNEVNKLRMKSEAAGDNKRVKSEVTENAARLKKAEGEEAERFTKPIADAGKKNENTSMEDKNGGNLELAGIPVCDIAASFQKAVVDVIVDKAISAATEFGEQKLVVAGGVAANSFLRSELAGAATEHGLSLYLPEPVLCTDNGAMIGAAAYYKYLKSGPDDLTLDAYADLPM